MEWKKFIGSRKFWAAITAVAIALCEAIGVFPATTQSIVGVIAAVGALAVYMVSQGLVDAAHEHAKEDTEDVNAD